MGDHVSTTDTLQEQPEWIKELRAKAKAHDKILPRLQRDLAVLRADLDESHPSFRLWEKDYGSRVRSGEASWADPDAVKADAQQYGLVKPEAPDWTMDAQTQARIEAASAEAAPVNPQTSARERMAQARTMEDFLASARQAGVAVVED